MLNTIDLDSEAGRFQHYQTLAPLFYAKFRLAVLDPAVGKEVVEMVPVIVTETIVETRVGFLVAIVCRLQLESVCVEIDSSWRLGVSACGRRDVLTIDGGRSGRSLRLSSAGEFPGGGSLTSLYSCCVRLAMQNPAIFRPHAELGGLEFLILWGSSCSSSIA